uniref:Transposase n=1 Tax=Loa loa TaxID=7209 RepID=A0A1I7W105_LOALO
MVVLNKLEKKHLLQGTGKRLKMNGYEQGVILDLMRGTSWIEGFFEAIEGICLSSPKLASEIKTEH